MVLGLGGCLLYNLARSYRHFYPTWGLMMTFRTHPYLSLFAIALTAMLARPSAAGTIEHEGWLFGEEAEKALELAEEHNVPVALMWTFRETSCPKCVGAARLMASAKSTKKMVRVMYYTTEAGDPAQNGERVTALFRKVHSQAKDESNYIPDLYFVMPDGRILGFVPYEEAGHTESEAKSVKQIGEWVNGMDKTLEKIDRDVDKGRYESALKKIDELVEQDAKISHMIQVQIGAVDKKEEMPETPVSLFFPNLKEEKVAQYKAAAMEKIAEAEALIEKDELRAAQRLLRTLSRTPEDFEANAKAKALMEKVTELLKAS